MEAVRNSFKPQVETLEARTLLTAEVSATLTGDLLRIVGTNRADHIIVREGLNSLDEQEEKEEDMLDMAWGLTPLSRLSCQARVRDNPLVIEIPKYTINHARENH